MSGDWELRPAGPEDLDAVAAVYRAEDLHYRGRSEVSAERLSARNTADPSFDALHDQIVAECAGAVVASAIIRSRAAMLAVDPEHDRPGLRASIVSWIEWRQAQRGEDLVRISVPTAFTPAVELLQGCGYRLERFYAEMIRDLRSDAALAPAAAPEGYRLRRLDPEADRLPLHALDDRAFRERPDYHAETLDQYGAHLDSPLFRSAWSPGLEAADGQLVGSLIARRRDGGEGAWVAILAVDPDHRRRGLARALLLDAFTAMAGEPDVGLHVASDNPRALDLYRGVGMREADRVDDYVRALG